MRKTTGVRCTDAKNEKHPMEKNESIVPYAGERSWIGQREAFIDRKSSSFSGGHEPGWREPKQTAGVETCLWQQVQLRSSEFI